MALKILNLHAENVKRLKVVDITPDGYIQIIGGNNSQGKSSVLDAIFLALGGSAASKEIKKPVRAGEDYGVVTLKLGEDYIVTREWKGDNSTLKVEAGGDLKGAKFSSPQALLDGLIGRIAFDPLAFIQLSPKDQVAALLKIVDLDINLEALDADKESIYETRTEVGRTVKSLKGQLDGLGPIEEAPKEAISVADLLTEVREAERLHRDYIEAVGHRDALTQRIADLEQQIVSAKAELQGQLKRLSDAEPMLPDLAKMQDQLSNAEETNNKVRRNAQRLDVKSQLDNAEEEVSALSAKLDEIEATKKEALDKAKFPIPGLNFSPEGVTYNDIPIAQASMSEQIRIALAIAMSGDPKLRVARIMDGSLLDDDTLKMIEQMAKDSDFQIWIERVGDKDELAVIIEDGEVKA